MKNYREQKFGEMTIYSPNELTRYKDPHSLSKFEIALIITIGIGVGMLVAKNIGLL